MGAHQHHRPQAAGGARQAQPHTALRRVQGLRAAGKAPPGERHRQRLRGVIEWSMTLKAAELRVANGGRGCIKLRAGSEEKAGSELNSFLGFFRFSKKPVRYG